jgi:hypothetical protein
MSLLLRTCTAGLLVYFLHGHVLARDPKPARTSPEASAYLEAALDIMEKNSLHRDKIDWPSLRARARDKAAGARKPADTHAAVRFALEQLGDHHSYLAPPPKSLEALLQELLYHRPQPRGNMVARRWAHVRVPACDGSKPAERQEYIDQLHKIVRQLDGQGPAGWIIDLRGNTGGDMWAMLAGIGPILGEGELGAFTEKDGGRTKWYFRGGKALLGKEVAAAAPAAYVLRQEGTPVAVLIDADTASSGEAVAISFRGRPRVRSFGQPTAGLSTANDAFPLSDGATLVLTISIMIDRTGKVYGGVVEPDEKLPADGKKEAVLQAAVAWLEKQAKAPAARKAE